MEYDFSKIEMEDLRGAVMHKVSACYGIDCDDCPLNNVKCLTANYRYTDEANEIFKQELNRREKMENKMPELSIGDIVILEDGREYLMLPQKDRIKTLVMTTKSGQYCIINSQKDRDNIKEIYREFGESTNYYSFFSQSQSSRHTYKLYWAKKSDKDIKIEELEATIKKAQEQIQELKG